MALEACPARPIPTGRPPSRRRGCNRGRLRRRRWAPAGCSRACEGPRARWYVREESSWPEARANGRVEPGSALPISCESLSGVGPSRSLEPRTICFSTLKQSQKAHEGRGGRAVTPSLELRNAAVGTELSPKSLQLWALALICCQPPHYPACHHPAPPDLQSKPAGRMPFLQWSVSSRKASVRRGHAWVRRRRRGPKVRPRHPRVLLDKGTRRQARAPTTPKKEKHVQAR